MAKRMEAAFKPRYMLMLIKNRHVGKLFILENIFAVSVVGKAPEIHIRWKQFPSYSAAEYERKY